MSLRKSPRHVKAVSTGIVAATTTTATRRVSGRTTTAAASAVTAVKEEEAEDVVVKVKGRGRPKGATKRKVESDDELDKSEDEHKPAKGAAKAVAKPKEAVVEKPTKKAKTTAKAVKAGEAPLAARTDVSTLKKAMYIGAHVSSAGGVQNAVGNAQYIGGNAFALFLKSQRTWTNAALTDEARDGFRAQCASLGFDAARHCLPHGSYLVNLAQADAAKAEQAYGNFVDDLRRCAALGIRLYNFHPGAAVAGTGTREEALARIAAALNRAHRDTAPSDVVTVIENMAGGGTTVGNRFEDLRAIIDGVDDKQRVGVCLDTCHAFAAGYDLRTAASFAAVVAEFDAVVGLSYLRAVHCNDSKAPLDSRRDLHANIGTGFLGLRAFHCLVNHDAFSGLPIVLETPIDRPDGKAGGKTVEDRRVWADEIKLLESLVGMDPDTDAFAALEADMQAQGAAERGRLQEQVNKRKKK
ncbi:DNA endonuclease [Grosmannia clavigera kw1407]|uniref:Apurinic-apyrimidinic endonuclease 1 n=1 Tax=Grosmannia clavigera (strain kw1407 / UAMH 11150) TaxID=655863 RepID=F0X9D3_GROCL|nr:DNA endonuclease [Grosmannia clavigera kw1407]EFX05835.1 DNA endonuclease [Grosmannia clavigera kw1407]